MATLIRWYCPQCGGSATIMETRRINREEVRRRYECLANPSHRFSTIEQLAERTAVYHQGARLIPIREGEKE